MYEIIPRKSTEYVSTYMFHAKNGAGQSMEFMIFDINENRFARDKHYAVGFYVSDKRKQGFQWNEITGRDGLKSLLWAKKCLLWFMEDILNPNDKVLIFSDGSRRLNAYEWGLKKLGFFNGKYKGNKCLIYTKK